ncbi:olfactory receptor 52K1-like [Bufo gargarizans]|uniref:olfactory receptor 52K1-like n=1 Tax=Bufo gargarizans TaxID=30331 RepID=UPI001CF46BB7|nr:olfactory receptor 52K1-like [Bufo gargarizans]
MANQSDSLFTLVGFPGLPEMYHPAVSCILFLVYVVSLSANSSVILLVLWKEHLHQPMYIIIMNLALSDILFDTITLPKIIAKYWFGAGTMTLFACMFQLFCVHFLGSLDSLIIMFMALDRYVAISRPLRYSAIITKRRTINICIFLCVLASLISLINAAWYTQFTFCGSRKVNSCFCVSTAVMILVCSDTSLLKAISHVLSMSVLLAPLCYILLSYVLILVKVCSSVRNEGLQKAFSTCVTHLFIIFMYYGPRVFVYNAFQINLVFSPGISVLLLCLYTYIPHLLSPIIYCLRTQEIRQVIGSLLRRKFNIRIEIGGVLHR